MSNESPEEGAIISIGWMRVEVTAFQCEFKGCIRKFPLIGIEISYTWWKEMGLC